MNVKEVLGAFLLVNNPIVLSEEETKDVQKAIKKLQQENKELKLQLKGTTHCFDKEEHEKLKKQLEELEKENFNLRENIYINKISFSSEGKNIKELIEMPTYEDLINQQKEFIEYMNKTIEELESDDVDDEEMKGYLIQRIDTFKEILQKYKNIIGVLDDKK